MYAVVVIGSRIRKSACGMNFKTFCAMAAPGRIATAITTAAVVVTIRPVERNRLIIGRTLIYRYRIGYSELAKTNPATPGRTQAGVSPLHCITPFALKLASMSGFEGERP